MKNVILDTDIGNDVDDMFALIMLAKMKEIRLRGVTTTYGDTKLQARMCRYLLDKLGRIDVPVFSGEDTPLSGKPVLRGPHVSGGFPSDLVNVQANQHTSAVDFLLEQSRLHDGDLEILCIGPLTNIAKAVQMDPDFPSRITKLTIMGGMIYPDKNPVWLKIISRHNGEYNISCDLNASRIVFSSGFQVTLIPLDVTTTVAFTRKHRDYFCRMPFGLGEILERELDIWWLVTSQMDEHEDYRNNPHDPMAVVSMYDESFFQFNTGRLSIGPSHGLEGMTLFEASENSTTKAAVEVDPKVLDEITLRIVR